MPPEIPEMQWERQLETPVYTASPAFIENRRVKEILEILNFANMAYVKAEIGEEELEEDDAEDYGMDQVKDPEAVERMKANGFFDDEEAEKAGMKRASLITKPRQFNDGTVRLLLDQTTDQVISQIENSTTLNGDMLMESGLTLREATKNDVLKNMYLGVSIDEEAGKLVFEANIFDQATDSVSKNILNRVLNAKGNQLRVDPTMPLVEHMMEPVLLQGAKNGNISEPLVITLLGTKKMKDLENRLEYFSTLEYEDESSLEYAAVTDLLRHRQNIENAFDSVYNQVTGDYFLDYFDGTRTNKGDFGQFLSGEAEKEGPAFFDVPEILFEQTPVDIEKFDSDAEYLNKTVFGWIGDAGGVENPSTYLNPNTNEPFNKYEKSGHGEPNRLIRDQIKEFKDSFIKNGEITPAGKDEAHQTNMTPEQWFTTSAFNIVKGFMGFDPETGMSPYDEFTKQQTEVSRRSAYADNNSALDKDLKTALFKDRSLWINNQPVDNKRVSDMEWQRYRDIFANNSPEDAMGLIEGDLDAAVAGLEFSNDSNRQARLMAMAIEKGIIDADTDPKFIAYFKNNVVPGLSSKAGLTDVEGSSAINDLYEGYFESLPVYQQSEKGYKAQIDPTGPPPAPTSFTWDGKDYDIPAMPSWGAPSAPQPKDFDLTPIIPQLQEMALDRPEFTKWLSDQIKLPGFEQAYRDVSVPQVDSAAISDQFDMGYDEWITEFEQKQADVEKTYQANLAVAGTEFGDIDEQIVAAAEADYAAAKAELQRERRESEASRVVDKEFMTGGGHKQLMVQAATTPAQTSQQFFESRLPGFEKRFEQSPFFRLEQERIEREGEADVARQTAEQKRLESERRRRLRSGTGTRGRTIITRGRA